VATPQQGLVVHCSSVAMPPVEEQYESGARDDGPLKTDWECPIPGAQVYITAQPTIGILAQMRWGHGARYSLPYLRNSTK
jgi:hypothetical protein